MGCCDSSLDSTVHTPEETTNKSKLSRKTVDGDKPIILVTGISGYAGSQVALALLEDGSYKVRGTVRDKNNAAKI